MSRYAAPVTFALSLILALVVGVAVLASTGNADNEELSSTAPPTLESLVTPPPTQAAGEQASIPSSTSTPTSDRMPVATGTPPPTEPPAATPTAESLSPASQPTEVPRDIPVEERLVDRPVQIAIPKIGVDTRVEWVGLDQDGNMDVPSGYDTTAWFEHGTRPGMTGNAVIAGHLDSQSGPAVFYSLNSLAPGDEVVVTTQAGEVLTFRVDRVEAFQTDSAPLYEIFGPSSDKRLNLITCEGDFNPTERAYDKRLVVYTSLVEG